MNGYNLVFDVGTHGYTAWRAAIAPASAAVIAIAIAAYVRRMKLASEQERPGLYFALVVVAAVLLSGVSISIVMYTWEEYDMLRAALKAGEFVTVEGRVDNFVPEGPDGHPTERFRVGDSSFSYSTSDFTSAFHQTAAQGGPIREGLSVRIADVNGAIARLEIAR